MIIRGKQVCVFDIESFKNVFSCIVKNTETKKIFTFEISERKNNVKDLVNLFKDQTLFFCGYNNKHYDDPIINFIILNITTIPEFYLQITKTINNLSGTIIKSDDIESWKQWKYAKCYESMDLLTMLFSSKLRVGLKEMQVTMGYPNVQEYSGDFEEFLPVQDIDEMLKYNLNDVLSTEELLNRCQKEIKLRLGIEKEFNIDVLSKDGMTIGVEILKTKYLQATGKSWWEIKDLRSPCDIIDLNTVIFPFIQFDTPILKELLAEMKQQKVSPGRKGYEKHFLLDGVEVTVGVGGIHTKNEPEIIIPKEDERLLDSDVNSLYPSLIISYNLVPPHLGKEFLQVYDNIRLERLEAKHHPEIEGNDIKNSTYKLALNGATGNYQNEHSWLYAPHTVMEIRINGQLLLLKLTEMLLKAGAHLKQLNTDGILYTIPRSVDYKSILAQWEKLTKLTLETESYDAFYQFAINDYLAVGEGYFKNPNPKLLKYKGLFIETTSLGKGMQPTIIPKAINAYFTQGIPVEKTIKESKNLMDFLTYQKPDKKFSVEYDGELITRINRYYASTNGAYLFKCVVQTKDEKVPMVNLHMTDGNILKVPKKDTEYQGKYWYSPLVKSIEDVGEIIIHKGIRKEYTNMLKSSGVTLANDLSKFSEFPDNINYNYYIGECYKIIDALEKVQLSLF